FAPAGTSAATALEGRGSPAHRAAHYQTTDAFFLDENAYPEPTGFWVAGGRVAAIVLGNSVGDFDLFVRNAPVDNIVSIHVDNDRNTELTLQPGEERIVRLPKLPRGAYRVVRVMSQHGFRADAAAPAQ